MLNRLFNSGHFSLSTAPGKLTVQLFYHNKLPLYFTKGEKTIELLPEQKTTVLFCHIEATRRGILFGSEIGFTKHGRTKLAGNSYFNMPAVVCNLIFIWALF